MNLLIFFVFLFSNLWGATQAEKKRAWTDTGYGFENLFGELNTELCYQSEEKFNGCLMAFEELLLSIQRGEAHEAYGLRISDLNEFKIVPVSKKDLGGVDDFLEFREELRKSFRSSFKRIMASGDGGVSVPADSGLAGSQSALSLHIQQFNSLVKKIRELVEKIPHEDRSYLAGSAYNTYLRETFGPHNQLSPVALNIPKPVQSFGIGAFSIFYKKDNGDIHMVIDPLKGSPAEAAGLKKGDIILSVDGFEIKDIPPPDQDPRDNDITKRIKGPAGTRVNLKIQSVCDKNQKWQRDVVITRGRVTYFSHWVDESQFISLTQREDIPDCGTEPLELSGESVQTHGEQDHRAKEDIVPNSVEPVGLYVPLTVFEPFNNEVFQLCFEFLFLQKFDLQNPYSRGMIIDLRGNPGGYLSEVACMLNTIIDSDDVIVREWPVSEGKLVEVSEETRIRSYYFTGGGFKIDSLVPLAIYNRNIVVLVDNKSVSAPEVFAGTLQDMKRGLGGWWSHGCQGECTEQGASPH